MPARSHWLRTLSSCTGPTVPVHPCPWGLCGDLPRQSYRSNLYGRAAGTYGDRPTEYSADFDPLLGAGTVSSPTTVGDLRLLSGPLHFPEAVPDRVHLRVGPRHTPRPVALSRTVTSTGVSLPTHHGGTDDGEGPTTYRVRYPLSGGRVPGKWRTEKARSHLSTRSYGLRWWTPLCPGPREPVCRIFGPGFRGKKGGGLPGPGCTCRWGVPSPSRLGPHPDRTAPG